MGKHDSSEKPLQSILQKVDDAVENGETDLKTLIQSFENRAFGPILTLVGIFMMTPLGAIPGVPIAFAIIVIAFAGQLLLARPTPWMPKMLSRVKIRKTKVDKARRFVRPVLTAVDGVLRPRLQWMATGPATVIAALFSIILALTMFPLGAVPFGVVIPGFLIGLFGLGIMARDGIVMSIAFSLSVASAFFITRLIGNIELPEFVTRFLSQINLPF